jgi:outer membrane biosynthesis protein TonB
VEIEQRMSPWHDGEFRPKRDVIAIPTLWVALVLSLIVHIAALWEWLPRIPPLTLDALAPSETDARLAVRIAPPESAPAAAAPAAPPSSAPKAQPPPAAKPRPPKAVTRAPPAPSVIAVAPPAPGIALPPQASPPVVAPTPPPAPTSPPLEGDLSSYIASRRRARGEPEPSSRGSTASAPSAEDDIARRDRIVASNLASINSQTFGEPRNSGGIFSITRMGYTDAEFTFFGWNKDIRRRASQRIEVQQGANSDIRIAVIRKMIAIIREHEQGDFLWESRRLGRNISLSARPDDNAGLEDFMMREFFDVSGAPR